MFQGFQKAVPPLENFGQELRRSLFFRENVLLRSLAYSAELCAFSRCRKGKKKVLVTTVLFRRSSCFSLCFLLDCEHWKRDELQTWCVFRKVSRNQNSMACIEPLSSQCGNRCLLFTAGLFVCEKRKSYQYLFHLIWHCNHQALLNMECNYSSVSTMTSQDEVHRMAPCFVDS